MELWEALSKIVAPIIQATAVAVTAYFASRGLNAWRVQLIGKRRMEVAEEALLSAYKMRVAIKHIRNPGAFGSEGKSRQRDGDEPDDIASRRDTYFVPFERMQKHADTFAQFEKSRLLCQVHFGTDAGKPFDEILNVIHSISIAAGILIEMVGEREIGPSEGELIRTERQKLYDVGRADDPVTQKVNSALSAIETLCKPYLKGSAT